MAKFKKKPIVVEAQQWSLDKPHPAVKQTAPERGSLETRGIMNTKHGMVFVVPGDWIIAEQDGSGYYPCKNDIFLNTYDPVEE